MVVLPQAEYLELQQRHQQSATPLEQKHDKVLHQYREHFNIHDPIEQQYKAVIKYCPSRLITRHYTQET